MSSGINLEENRINFKQEDWDKQYQERIQIILDYESEKNSVLEAVDWLGNNATQISKDNWLSNDCLNDLRKRFIKESDSVVKRNIRNTVRKIIGKRWESSNVARQAILDEVLGILQDRDGHYEIQEATVEWLRENAANIAGQSYSTYKRVTDALDAILFEDGLSESLNKSIRSTLKAIWTELHKQHYEKLKNILKNPQASENDKTLAIWQLSDINVLGSRESLRFLVEVWVNWICADREPRLVELTAESIRYNHYAVLALLEHFGRRSSCEISLSETQSNGGHIHEDSPAFDMSISTVVNTEFQKIEKHLKHLEKHHLDWIDKGSGEDGLLELSELEEAERLLANPKTKENPNFKKDLEHFISASRKAANQAFESENLLRVNQRIAKQLADMSDPAFFEVSESLEDKKRNKEHLRIIKELKKHAVPVLLRHLPVEDEDNEIRENIVRMLGYTGGREAVDALANQVISKERMRKARQDLLSKYYLEPSQKRSQEASEILEDTISESRRTLKILQWLNIATFVVGMSVLSFGLYFSMTSTNSLNQVVGGLSAIGGFAGVITLLIKDPLDRIQKAMAKLVQVETAFTSFIWGLNLNGTFIQSRYVKNGKLEDYEVKDTAFRIEKAMESTMNLVSRYTEEGDPRLLTRINKIEPAASKANSLITVYGQHLLGDSSQKKEHKGLVAIDHNPVEVDLKVWKEQLVKFNLPDVAPKNGTILISLIIDGMETNAIPFHMVNGSG